MAKRTSQRRRNDPPANRHRLSSRTRRPTQSPAPRAKIDFKPPPRSTPVCTANATAPVAHPTEPKALNDEFPALRAVASRCVEGAMLPALIGMAVAMTIHGLSVGLSNAFGGASASRGAAIAGALLGLAAGIRLPQGMAVWACRVSGAHFASRGRRLGLWTALTGPSSVDRNLHRVVLAVVALGAGIMTAMSPMAVGLVSSVHDSLQANFLWARPVLGGLHLLLAVLTSAAPMAALGLALACTHHVSCPHGQWNERATSHALLGAGLGVVAAGLLSRTTAPPGMTLCVASLPSFLACVVAAVVGPSMRFQTVQPDRSPRLPYWRDRWSALLRAVAVASGVASVGVLLIWHSAISERETIPGIVLGGALAALGGGMLATTRLPHLHRRCVGGFGGACAMAGLVIMPGAVTFTQWSAPPLLGASLFGLLSLLFLGFAIARGIRALLDRVADRSGTGAKVLARTVGLAAITVWVAVPVAIKAHGAAVSLAMIALSLVALGGTLIIHEPDYRPGPRRARIAIVFVALALMVVALPMIPRRRGERAHSSAVPIVALQSGQHPRDFASRDP